ncbi:MAG: tetratricopeptide repeat protein [Pyrinomonadaceae bacterium]|nr:tetratricopeptide repeat protein [Pyrinomonadaceae bacterium]
MKNFVTLLSFFTLIIVAGISGACGSEESFNDDAPKETVPTAELISQADVLFKERDDLTKLRQAILLFKRARNAEPNNYEATWKISRSSYMLGDRTNDAVERDKVYKDGINYGKSATKIQADKPEGYFWLGASYGGQAKVSKLNGIANVNDIKQNMQKVIELQPGFQGGTAFAALAQIELQTGSLLGGSAKKAVEYCEKALEFEKNNSITRTTLGEAYLSTNQKDKAKQQFEYVVNMKPDANFLPEHKEPLEKAQKFLATKF